MPCILLVHVSHWRTTRRGTTWNQQLLGSPGPIPPYTSLDLLSPPRLFHASVFPENCPVRGSNGTGKLWAWHSLFSSSSSSSPPGVPPPLADVPQPLQSADLVVISSFPHLVRVSASRDEVLQLSPFLPPPGDPGRIRADLKTGNRVGIEEGGGTVINRNSINFSAYHSRRIPG